MDNIIIEDDMGVPRGYTYEKVTGAYNGLTVDEFNIRALNDNGDPYKIQLIESETEVKVLLQFNNFNPFVSRKNIFEGMLPIFYSLYKKTIISSSLLYPTYENERRVPETAGRLYSRLFSNGIVFKDSKRDVYYYRN